MSDLTQIKCVPCRGDEPRSLKRNWPNSYRKCRMDIVTGGHPAPERVFVQEFCSGARLYEQVGELAEARGITRHPHRMG